MSPGDNYIHVKENMNINREQAMSNTTTRYAPNSTYELEIFTFKRSDTGSFSKTTFLSLPTEIRLRIYEFALHSRIHSIYAREIVREVDTYTRPDGTEMNMYHSRAIQAHLDLAVRGRHHTIMFPWTVLNAGVFPAILLTSRTIYQEAAPMMYSQVVLRLKSSCTVSWVYNSFSGSLTDIGYMGRTHIRYLDVWFALLLYRDCDWSQLQVITRLLRSMPNLRRAQVFFLTYRRGATMSVMAKIGQMIIDTHTSLEKICRCGGTAKDDEYYSKIMLLAENEKTVTGVSTETHL